LLSGLIDGIIKSKNLLSEEITKKYAFMALSPALFTELITVSAADIPQSLSVTYHIMKTALLIFALTLSVLVVACVAATGYLIVRKKSGAGVGNALALTVFAYASTLIVLVCGIFCYRHFQDQDNSLQHTGMPPTVSDPSTDPSITEPTPGPATEPTDPPFVPNRTENSDPDNWNVHWEILVNDSVVGSYKRPEEIIFGDAGSYTQLEGITTFRGNNYRTGATFGFSTVSKQTLSSLWKAEIGTFNTWPGAGWTGQPLVIRWDAETRAIMNLYEEKKAKEDLVEVIYATLDGFIHFYDLADGSQTRDPIWIGMNFKGAGTIDPRGYPLLYVGSGALIPDGDYSGTVPRMYIISLIDGSILYERTGYDSAAWRGWYAFDSPPLVDAETDTLIWPGESGVLYTIKLNSQFDKSAGTLTVEPETLVKTRYSTNLGHQVGFESSALIVDRYLFCADNGGMFFCIDLNTMELIWAQNTFDDVNATPVFRWEEDGKGYIYTATSMEYSQGISYIHKLDAATGEIVWEKAFDNVAFNQGVSGGVLSSPLLGKNGTTMEGMIIYSISRTPEEHQGLLLALDTKTGEILWERTMGAYAWSSPTAVYTEDGTAYLILCDSVGNMYLMDPRSGETLDTVNLGANVEASPVVFENTVVVGTRGKRVWGIKIS